ncbi:sugar transferase [Mucilaginibacter ginkgonis]|uniref:Sugar transferase n=1 Tax=Mucilaginibacter ginkgonis TaxID=2682091 RepID=A0A6I4HXZ5_9SPHI|nr:sugar transferase [Mucilaginibacter ginkgonis]QQL51241.1 sugar transferase [Mucilaginibacter ginkgonis]
MQNQLWPEKRQIHDNSVKVDLFYVGNDFRDLLTEELPPSYNFLYAENSEEIVRRVNGLTIFDTPDLIIVEADEKENHFKLIQIIRDNLYLNEIIIIVLSKWNVANWRVKMSHLRVHDYYLYPFSVNHIQERIALLLKLRLLRPNRLGLLKNAGADLKYKMPFTKRLFDILFSGFILLCLSPLLLLITFLVKVGSKGPAIYRSSRVGAGYKIFSFYKFRSMHSDADKKVGDFKNLNQYLHSGNLNGKPVFFKVLDDPRVTKLGRFLRSTSLDELPQLYNILIGDMSFVGNRPLPLYEAEQLTSNEWSKRFLGPAGLTGLWQIKQRGKAEVSELERKLLDNSYVTNHSFILDLKILFQTIPAIFQKAKV